MTGQTQVTMTSNPLLDQAINKLTSSFIAYGLSLGAVASPETSKAATSFDEAISLTRKLFANAAIPTVAVPEGYWLAPNRVTTEMTKAALEVEDLYRMGRPELPGKLFQAMRREAPLAPVVTLSVPSAEVVNASVLAKFEAWACSPKGKYREGDLLKFSTNAHQHAIGGLTYVNTAVEHDWQVWQAAAT